MIVNYRLDWLPIWGVDFFYLFSCFFPFWLFCGFQFFELEEEGFVNGMTGIQGYGTMIMKIAFLFLDLAFRGDLWIAC